MATLPFELNRRIEADEVQAFDEDISACLDRLQREVPFGRWVLTRMIGDDWVMLHSAGSGARRGDLVAWDQTICSRMTRDLRDTFLPVEREGACVSAPVRKAFDVGAYIGVALYQPSGEPQGTLASVDTRRRQPPRGPRQINALRTIGYLIVQSIEQARLFMRATRAATQGLLRQQSAGGGCWLPAVAWRQALKNEDELRQPLAAPAAVLAMSIKDGLALRPSAPASSAAAPRLGKAEHVLAGLVPDYLGTQAQAATLLVLIPECDQQRARQVETRLRLLLENCGIKVRCGAVSVRFDEPLKKAETAALRLVA